MAMSVERCLSHDQPAYSCTGCGNDRKREYAERLAEFWRKLDVCDLDDPRPPQKYPQPQR